MKKLVIGVIIVSVLVVIGLMTYRPKPPAPQASTPIDTKNQPTIGQQNAPVHIVAFEDLKCGNCARFTNRIFPKIKKQYIDTGIAKYTVINLAFIDGSMPAANAARCLYQQKNAYFFAFIHRLYANQPPEDQDWATVPYLMKMAQTIPGVNKQALSECIVKSPHTAFINNNLVQAMKIMHGRVATPTLFVNGIMVKPLNMNRLKQIIRATRQ